MRAYEKKKCYFPFCEWFCPKWNRVYLTSPDATLQQIFFKNVITVCIIDL